MALFLLLTLVSAAGARAEKVEDLSATGYVNDFAGVLDAGSKQSLEALCQEVDTKAGAQISVVTIHTLEGAEIEDFSVRLAQKWGVGPKGKDRGVLVLLVVDDHKDRVEVGYGLEPILTDGTVGGFQRDMIPLLRMNNYGGALSQITSQIATVIEQDRGVTLAQPGVAVPQPGSGLDGNAPGFPPQLILPLIFLLFFGGWRLLAFFLAMMGFSRFRRGRGYGGGWWMGPMGGYGGGGGSNWGGGGFGGFGGGSFGGGGASGSW